MALIDERPRADGEDPLRPHRFTWDEVLVMAENNVFGENRRAELIGGDIFIMPEEGFLHVDGVFAIQQWMINVLAPLGVLVRVREPVHFDDGTVMIPDLAVFPANTKARDMLATRALLVIEVADTTEARDRAVKFPRYAQAGVAEAWLVQARDRAILVHRAPMNGDWTSLQRVGPGETIAPLCAQAHAFAVDQLPEATD